MEDVKDAVWTTDRVVAILRELAKAEELPNHLIEGPITGADTVETLGIDSIGAVTLVDQLESEADVLLPDDFLAFEDSVDDIAKRMNSL